MYETAYRPNNGENAQQGNRRRIPVDAHVGTPDDFRARLIRAGREAALGLHRAEFFEMLFQWVTDERILYWAWEQLRRFGGQAPGVDVMSYRDVPATVVF